MSRSRSTGGDYTCQLYFDPRADESGTGGYWITDEELRQKLANLIDANEKIQKASVYSNPLHSWQLTNAKSYHEFLIMKTNNWWWSIEKNSECITIQRSKKLESVRDMYQRKKRTTGFGPLTKIRKNETTKDGNITINELINYFWRTDILNKDYHVVNANCKDFAAMVFNRIKSFECRVYFDEAADQHDNDNIADSTSGFHMTVDKALDEVRRCGGSEPFTKNLECYTLRLPFRQYFYSQLCATEGTYWSLEGTLFIHRAKNKDVLLNECQRHPRCTSLKDSKMVVSFLWNDMNKVMEYFCKNQKNKNGIFLNVVDINVISSLYNKSKRKSRRETVDV
ncbi:hypothetical protein OUZ56_020433 [Daphnia magna]|uniref:PPPDE domain-containing protein n=1 Tax=Daphnia magna TaxID=35525 RepID=A0ABQ9ZEG5_9CRUS|nr:hypothetical protein OUZ56_020433 [Daphnia magna]